MGLSGYLVGVVGFGRLVIEFSELFFPLHGVEFAVLLIFLSDFFILIVAQVEVI